MAYVRLLGVIVLSVSGTYCHRNGARALHMSGVQEDCGMGVNAALLMQCGHVLLAWDWLVRLSVANML